jgi:serine/threonine protein kinase
MHKLGIYHCDIEPSNINISKNGKPFLSDFGSIQFSSLDKTIIKELKTKRILLPPSLEKKIKES